MKLRRPLCPAAKRWLAVGLTTLVLISRAQVQPEPGERWLLVFDSSAAMKKRLPALEAAIQSFFTTSGNGHLHPGDSLGIWTFDNQLHTGQFPLTVWAPERAAVTASNLVAFIHRQHYGGTTTFAALQPLLNQVIETSQRLTLVIFCDGEGEITWTPRNDGINQVFRQNQAERKKARQPLVLVLRTQRGEYTGGTVNFPPCVLSIPAFPPLPAPPPPKPIATNPPPAPPVVKAPPAVLPPLILTGPQLPTNPPPVARPTTPQVPGQVAASETNSAPPAPILPPITNAVLTNPVAAPVAPAAPVTNLQPATNVQPVTTQKTTNALSPPTTSPAANVSVTAIEKPTNLPSAPPTQIQVSAPVATNVTTTKTNATTPNITTTPTPTGKVTTLTVTAPKVIAINILAATDDNAGTSRRLLLASAGLLLTAGALAVFLVARRRGPAGSLITRSMRDDPHRK